MLPVLLREKCTTNVKLGRAITRDGYEEYRERMGAKINTAEGRAIYGKRKCLVESVVGQMKTRNGLKPIPSERIRESKA